MLAAENAQKVGGKNPQKLNNSVESQRQRTCTESQKTQPTHPVG